MTQEEKELLLKDLCGRLPYGNSPKFTLGVFKWKDDEPVEREIDGTLYDRLYLQLCVYNTDNMSFKPYLRPMSSMTEEEEEEYDSMFSNARRIYCNCVYYDTVQEDDIPDFIDWLIEHHFDYRKTPDGKTMIEAGLAIEAPEGMYKID